MGGNTTSVAVINIILQSSQYTACNYLVLLPTVLAGNYLLCVYVFVMHIESAC